MASKNKKELEMVVEKMQGSTYVAGTIKSIHTMVNAMAKQMVDHKEVECDDPVLVAMALEEIVFGAHYSGKDVEDRYKETEGNAEAQNPNGGIA
jgi:radical SAM superfamily enzyme with C-terminal helix-hairpin-helix motif